MKHGLGIVGFGGMGSHHAREIVPKDRIDIVGICDVDPKRLDVARREGYRTCGSFEEMLADDAVEIILVATPNNFHRDLCIAALRHGKHVICEKPVTMHSDELADIMAVAKETGKLFTVHQNRRMDIDYLMVKKAVTEDRLLGDVFCIESRVQGSRGVPEGWRQYPVAGGGMMLDWGVHLIDQIMMMISEKVTSVFCKMYSVHYKEVDDCFKLFLTFESGITALIEVSTSTFISLPRWHVSGADGTLLIPDWNCDCTVTRAKDTEIQWEEEIVYTKAGPTKTMAPRPKHTIEEIKPAEPTTDYTRTYRALADAIEGNGAPLVDPAEAMRVMQVMEASFASSRKNEVIHTNI